MATQPDHSRLNGIAIQFVMSHHISYKIINHFFEGQTEFHFIANRPVAKILILINAHAKSL